MINYRGAFLQKLEQVIEENPENTLGEILLHFLHTNEIGKHYFYATDGEIYTSLESFSKRGIEKEECMIEEEFTNWVNTK